jgi:hypothetical protein
MDLEVKVEALVKDLEVKAEALVKDLEVMVEALAKDLEVMVEALEVKGNLIPGGIGSEMKSTNPLRMVH